MSAKKSKLLLGMVMCLTVLVACGSNDKKEVETERNVEKKSETVSFMRDINVKNERVWLCLKGKFNKDVAVRNAIHVKDGTVEVIDVALSLREIDDVEDKDLWDYLVRENQDHFEKSRSDRINDVTESIKSNAFTLKRFDKGYTEIDGITKEQAQDHLDKSINLKEKIELTEKVEPIKVKVDANVKTDSSGNQTISETLTLNPTEEGVILLFNNGYSYGNFTYIPTGNMEVLLRKYTGYQGENSMFITRKTDDIKMLTFDTADEKGVKEDSVE